MGCWALERLAKGPVAPALAVLIVGAYAVLRRDGKIFVRSLSLPGFVLFFAIVLPWYLAVQHKVPQFFRVFFIEHNLERFGTNLYQHSQPFWYYIPVFLLATLPWTVFALPALVEAGRVDDQAAACQLRNHHARSRRWLVQLLVCLDRRSDRFLQHLPRQAARLYPAGDSRGRAAHGRLSASCAKRLSRLKIALHALLCAVLLVGALMAPFAMVKVPPPSCMQIGMIVTGGSHRSHGVADGAA